MRLLLDTHAILWWLSDDDALPSAFRSAIGDSRNEVLVSAISLAEIAVKASLGKLEVPDTLWTTISTSGFDELPFTGLHAEELAGLPWLHRDPFDRMLIAQARIERLTFATVDAACRRYEIDVL